MRASQEHMEKIRANLLDAAGQGFREEGYGGLGINALVQKAGMTSGAFYGHFTSKSEAFQEVVQKGLDDYAETIERLISEHGDNWPKYFMDYYLGQEHIGNLSCSCIVPGLSADVTRADVDTQAIYAHSTKNISTKITAGLNRKNPNDAWALMALLAGAVMMARCCSDSPTSKEIIQAAKVWAAKIIGA